MPSIAHRRKGQCTGADSPSWGINSQTQPVKKSQLHGVAPLQVSDNFLHKVPHSFPGITLGWTPAHTERRRATEGEPELQSVRTGTDRVSPSSQLLSASQPWLKGFLTLIYSPVPCLLGNILSPHMSWENLELQSKNLHYLVMTVSNNWKIP